MRLTKAGEPSTDPDDTVLMTDAETTTAPDARTLERLVALVQCQRDLERELTDLDEKRKKTNVELEKVAGGYRAEGDIPALLQELGVETLTLADGTKVTVRKELKPPSMAAGSKHRDAVVAWLDEVGHGDAVKDTVTVLLAKDDPRAVTLLAALDEVGVPYDRFRTVNPQTLGALLRELLEAGDEVPLDDLGVLVFRRSKLS